MFLDKSWQMRYMYMYLRKACVLLVPKNTLHDLSPHPFVLRRSLKSRSQNKPRRMRTLWKAQTDGEQGRRIHFSLAPEHELSKDTSCIQCLIAAKTTNAADKENMGQVDYYPSPAIPNYYFPFKNMEGYLSPFVMVHFIKPVFGVLINVECKAWAKNIQHDRMERKGSVHFELLVD